MSLEQENNRIPFLKQLFDVRKLKISDPKMDRSKRDSILSEVLDPLKSNIKPF